MADRGLEMLKGVRGRNYESKCPLIKAARGPALKLSTCTVTLAKECCQVCGVKSSQAVTY